MSEVTEIDLSQLLWLDTRGFYAVLSAICAVRIYSIHNTHTYANQMNFIVAHTTHNTTGVAVIAVSC